MRVERQLSVLNCIFGFIVVCAMIHLAYAIVWSMNHYPNGYSVERHFLSDLGRLYTADGIDNSECSQKFSLAMILAGLSLILFFCVLAVTMPDGKISIGLSGIISAIGLIGIGITPYDRFFNLHHVALFTWLISMTIFVLIFLTEAYASNFNNKLLTIGSLAVLVATLGYAFGGSREGYVVMQKLLVVIAMLWMSIVIYTTSVSTVTVLRTRHAIATEQAREYLKRIEKSSWRKKRD